MQTVPLELRQFRFRATTLRTEHRPMQPKGQAYRSYALLLRRKFAALRPAEDVYQQHCGGQGVSRKGNHTKRMGMHSARIAP